MRSPGGGPKIGGRGPSKRRAMRHSRPGILGRGPRQSSLGPRAGGHAWTIGGHVPGRLSDGPSWAAGKRPSWPRATAQLATGHSPLIVLCPGPGFDTWRAQACITGHGPRPGCELRLAQLGPAHVAGIKKPGHRPGFEWPTGRVYGAAELRAASSHSSSSSSSGMHNAAASSKSPVRIASARSSEK
jgi:hypothetical protein